MLPWCLTWITADTQIWHPAYLPQWDPITHVHWDEFKPGHQEINPFLDQECMKFYLNPCNGQILNAKMTIMLGTITAARTLQQWWDSHALAVILKLLDDFVYIAHKSCIVFITKATNLLDELATRTRPVLVFACEAYLTVQCFLQLPVWHALGKFCPENKIRSVI